MVFKILAQLKRGKKYIQNNGGQSTNLYNHILKGNWHLSGYFYKKIKDNANESQSLPLEGKIT